jgi:(p)ppGpp synthase/HD superfamily hydrolase
MKQNWSIDEIQAAWKLASKLHYGQKYAGSNEGEQFEYLNHIGGVTFEILYAIGQKEAIDADLAIKCAILHDTIEDTELKYDAVKNEFGEAVADGVLALTKNEKLESKAAMTSDSLQRIKGQPKAVWAVKLADRIINLSPPPFHWTTEKRLKYFEEAKLIHRELKDGNAYLANRLLMKIENYKIYIVS